MVCVKVILVKCKLKSKKFRNDMMHLVQCIVSLCGRGRKYLLNNGSQSEMKGHGYWVELGYNFRSYRCKNYFVPAPLPSGITSYKYL